MDGGGGGWDIVWLSETNQIYMVVVKRLGGGKLYSIYYNTWNIRDRKISDFFFILTFSQEEIIVDFDTWSRERKQVCWMINLCFFWSTVKLTEISSARKFHVLEYISVLSWKCVKMTYWGLIGWTSCVSFSVMIQTNLDWFLTMWAKFELIRNCSVSKAEVGWSRDTRHYQLPQG